MYITEAMIQSIEETKRHASDMEKSMKMMMDSEGRMHGIELDRRNNARDMWQQLMDHINANMTAEPIQSAMMTEWHEEPPMDYPAMMSDPDMHTHDDGMTHSHDGGDMPHDHAPEDMDGLPSDVEPPMANTEEPKA